jgi:hypothetical protein
VNAAVDRAVLDGFQETLMGWRVAIRDGEIMRRGRPARRFNPRAAVNFPVQGGAADVTRLACNLASERGIPLARLMHFLTVSGRADRPRNLLKKRQGCRAARRRSFGAQ